MSGVAKDDTNPSQPADETVNTGASENGTPEAPATSVSDGEARAQRRGAPHLRVVTGNEEFDGDTPHQRIGAVMRAARENAGFTLDQVSKETRVHLSHLRAIEDMTPNLLGAPVYAKGYIKSYARFLGMDEQNTLDRYLSECAILKDPEKQEIAPPASSKARKLPAAVPVLGFLIVGLLGAGAYFFFAGSDKQAPASETATVAGVTPQAGAVAGADASAALGQRLTIVALKPGLVEVRSSKGDKYVHREFLAGESYPVRVGAGWTVSVSDGAAFEWRLGDQSLGLVSPQGGQVYSQSVDLAAQRPPVVVEPEVTEDAPAPAPSAAVSPSEPSTAPPASSAAPRSTQPATTRATPAPAPAKPKPKPQTPPPATTPATTQAPASQPQAQTPPRDPALAAYPDQ